MTNEPDREPGSNIGLSDAELRVAFARAVAVGKSVRVVGSTRVDTRMVSLDLHLNKDGSAASAFAINGGECRVRAVAGSYYFHLSAAFIAEWAGTEGRSHLDLSPIVSRWWPATSALGNFLIEHLGFLASYDMFLRRVVADETGGEVTAAGTAFLNGERVAVYLGEDGSTYYFAATGLAYLLKGTASPENDGESTEFTWNQPLRVEVPQTTENFRF
ncbi:MULTISPECIES: hypothetical protein [unclassified Streptomyces]|uniref:hypothetical protein n=1 Tax=unclassified Streptomyces TaxID=2593676 RepID=UPI00081DCD15|nr:MULTISPECIES: hypothetical protein [unclassified Streptomyces]MYZ38848.1 hypothetical protein [Streptomyces sp. SID4917]SCG00717.1 hypothetical protein GA0115259_107048 [Streptomyces sp. MnatMP-M17]